MWRVVVTILTNGVVELSAIYSSVAESALPSISENIRRE